MTASTLLIYFLYVSSDFIDKNPVDCLKAAVVQRWIERLVRSNS